MEKKMTLLSVYEVPENVELGPGQPVEWYYTENSTPQHQAESEQALEVEHTPQTATPSRTGM